MIEYGPALDLMSTAEAAAHLRVDEFELRNLMFKDGLRAYSVGKALVWDVRDLTTFRAQRPRALRRARSNSTRRRRRQDVTALATVHELWPGSSKR